MEIRFIEIRRFVWQGTKTMENAEGDTHVKALPMTSVVQAVEGFYAFACGENTLRETGEGGFFLAPSQEKQTIVHHRSPQTGVMRCRWLFLDVWVNYRYRFDDLFSLPPILPESAQKEMNALFDALEEKNDLCDAMSLCYQVVKLLLSAAVEKPKREEDFETALRFLRDHASEKLTVADLAAGACVSPSGLFRLFRKNSGRSPIAYLNEYRLNLAAERLLCTDESVSDVSAAVGFTDPLYFSRLFSRFFGVSPGNYRRHVM